MKELTEVAAAVFRRPDGSVLLAQRPSGKPYPGFWEFPGGKIEHNESVLDALKREIREELDVEVLRATPWVTRVHVYTHATVRLHFCRVVEWRGEFRGMEDQAHVWTCVDAAEVAPMLPANAPILKALALPELYALSDAHELGEQAFIPKLDAALESGLRLVQVREKHFSGEKLEAFAVDVSARAHAHGARVIVGGDATLARRVNADGVHLSAPQVEALRERPDLPLVGASCHSRAELMRAADLGADFAVLGSVLPTRSHPGVAPMGWDHFHALIQDAPIPVYAIGGLTATHLERALACGAHGIAMQRGAWGSALAGKPTR